jgi:phospholipid/cholesterol/gamma-HCH transport system ATP-binding protein
MIAQYQKKFNFTAVLVSHEIPDVYFISNRILALYDHSIVFQGTPEELETFDHPFMDEVISSLEGLQKELTGLYSKRQFKMLNHIQMERRRLSKSAYDVQGERRKAGSNYCIVVFALSEMDMIVDKSGYDAAQEIIHSMGVYIDKHFGAMGGLSTRHKANEIVTVLPFANLEETENILNNFAEDFQRRGINDIWSEAQNQASLDKCIDFAILAGIAQGQPVDEIDFVIASAESQQKEIGRMHCAARE